MTVTRMKFLDQARIHVKGGDGGDGCVGFRREKHVEFGGPDGGDGGRGGDVVARAVAALDTLIDYRYRQHVKARAGRPGSGRDRTGADGKTVELRMPVGTQILDGDGETLIADLIDVDDKVVLAKGGAGGRGNAFYKSAINRAPRRADPGGPGEERWLWLRLKLIADAGLVGLPNAGKSTLVAAVSGARPKIADYPFTTLHPHLGVVRRGDEECVLADIPGLISGAHEGAGIGDRFLGHVERCGLLVHLVDGTREDVADAYRTVRAELAAYGHGLDGRRELAVLGKCDALDPDAIARKSAALAAASGTEVHPISAVSGYGVDVLLNNLLRAVRGWRRERTNGTPATTGWSP